MSGRGLSPQMSLICATPAMREVRRVATHAIGTAGV